MVYIASHNIISSLGFTLEENKIALRKNESGIKESSNSELTPEPAFVSLTDKIRLNKEFSEISNNVEYTDYEKLLILSVHDALKNTRIRPDDPETLFLFSTTKGNIDLLQSNKNDLFEQERVQLWKSSEIVSQLFKNPNPPVTISNACISGTLAIIVAKRLLESGKYKHAVVAGAEILPEFTLSGFIAFKAVSDGPCRPFDKDRTGMTPGEGAGTIILTTDESFAGDDKIMITGGASSNDANHISGPSRTGEELALTIQNSISESKITADDIDYISGHGTATPYNDETEAKAITLAGLDKAPVNSIKGYTGHTFGAAGIIETIIGFDAIKTGHMYKSVGYKNQGTENKLNVLTENKTANIQHVLKTASGFGGCNASLVLSSKNRKEIEHNETEFTLTKKVTVKDNKVFVNDTEINIESEPDFGKFIKAVYKEFGIKYPKFYKMDKLCKLAFAASEILLKDANISERYNAEDIAVILSNGSSSLDTDIEYQKTIDDRNNYFPSPAVFVYTLANIMIGEICIRNKIKGENAVFVSKDYEKDFLFEYVDILFKTGKAKACITGRADYAYPGGEYFAELYLAEIKK